MDDDGRVESGWLKMDQAVPAEFRPPLVRNASVVATDLIREAIMDGRLQPGRRLKEEELAQELGISRTPVRQALHMLESEGLIESAPNKGATVKSYSLEELNDMYQLRALLEGFGARLAAERISEQALDELRRSCERFAQLRNEDGDVTQLVRENIHFHTVIAEAAENRRLSYFTQRVMNLPLVYRSYYWYSPDLRLISEHYHRQLTRALETHDGERAELTMKQHILEAKDFLVTRFEEEHSGDPQQDKDEQMERA